MQLRRWLPAVVALTAAVPLSAQVPVVTPQGDPSVDDDTIYALVVDPAEYSEYAAVRLLDDGIVSIDEDGSYTTTYRTVLQILKPEAVAGWSEFTWTVDPEHERFGLNWVRVLRPDGTLITDEPLHYQESDVPVGGPGAVYTDLRQISFSLSGVETGTIIDYSTTIETFDPVLAGDLRLSWGITTGTPVRRSRYLLDTPRGLELRIDEENLPVPVEIRHHGDRTTRAYIYADLETIDPEPFAADSPSPYASLLISGANDWSDVAEWYAELARDRYDLGTAVAAAVDSIADRAADGLEIRALHRWIAQDIRYVSLSLGIGGYQPRTPDEVWQSRAGDCKDKATLFVAAARRLGYEAYPVLVQSGGWADRDHPSLSQFDHEIAAYRRPGEAWQFADLTADLVPHGDLPIGIQGSFGLLVHDDGTHEEVTLPLAAVEENLKRATLTGELLPDASFTGWYVEDATGFPSHGMRHTLADPIDPSRHQEVANSIARGIFPSATGDSLHLFVGREWSEPTSLRLMLRTTDLVDDLGGGRYLLPLPLQQFSEWARPTIAQLEADTLRVFDIDAELVSGSAVVEQVLTLTLPEGWTAEIPDDVTATSEFGGYEATYEQEGRVLRVVRRLVGARGTYSRERLPDLFAWLHGMAEDDARFILISAP